MREKRVVHPLVHEMKKLWPQEPPERGEIVLVDGERCRIVKDPLLRWNGLIWTLVGPIVVTPEPPDR